MFEHLKRKLRGVLSFEELALRSEQYMARQIDTMTRRNIEHPVFGTLGAKPKWFEAWRMSHHNILLRLANCPSRNDQLIALRRETVELIK